MSRNIVIGNRSGNGAQQQLLLNFILSAVLITNCSKLMQIVPPPLTHCCLMLDTALETRILFH